MRWYKAVSQFEMKSHDDAIDSLTELQSDEAGHKQFPQTHHVLGLIYADRGQFTEAASEYRRYLELAPNAPAGDGIKRQLYEAQFKSLAEAIDIANEEMFQSLQCDDFKEGVASFMQRRAPRFERI